MPTDRPIAVDLAAATLAVAVATGAGQLLRLRIDLPNLSMVFLVPVLFCAVRIGARAALFASVLSALAYDFFFIEPRFALNIAEPAELLALAVFLAVAILTGSLTGRLRRQAAETARAAAEVEALYAFARLLSAALTRDDVIAVATRRLRQTREGGVALFAPIDGALSLRRCEPPDMVLDGDRLAAARRAFQTGRPVTWRDPLGKAALMQFRPLRTSRAVVGVCGLGATADMGDGQAVAGRMTDALLEQTAVALDRTLLIEDAMRAAALEETAALQDALLASLSHDLRTPLATVTGAASSLRELGDRMSPEQRLDLLLSIEGESARLARLVSNLLDIGRIESGALVARRDWVDVNDVARGAVARGRRAFPGKTIALNAAPSLPYVRGAATLLEQALFNLIDNAQKHGGEGAVAVHARREGSDVILSVTDEGPGIKPADLQRVFDKFRRGRRKQGHHDAGRAGAGLGLAICRGFVSAMGGAIEAQSPAMRRRGTRVVIRLPAVERPMEEPA